MTMKGERILTTVLMVLLKAKVTQAADSLADSGLLGPVRLMSAQ
jgi:hypothetical protein